MASLNSQSDLLSHDYTITFDGGSKPNPGAGYGSFLIQTRAGDSRLVSNIAFGDNMTNNQAEYNALIAALKNISLVIKIAGKDPRKYTVAVWGDSMLVIKQLKREWSVNDEALRVLHKEADALLKQFKAVSLNWHNRTNSVKLLGH